MNAPTNVTACIGSHGLFQLKPTFLQPWTKLMSCLMGMKDNCGLEGMDVIQQLCCQTMIMYCVTWHNQWVIGNLETEAVRMQQVEWLNLNLLSWALTNNPLEQVFSTINAHILSTTCIFGELTPNMKNPNKLVIFNKGRLISHLPTWLRLCIAQGKNLCGVASLFFLLFSIDWGGGFAL